MPVPASIDELSPTASANYPLGTEQVFPNLDNYLRFHAACLAQLRDRLDSEGLPLASVMWWGGVRASMPARFAPMDGQPLSRATYSALWAMVSAGGYPLITDAAWVRDAGARASFSSGDGATTFRMPDLNGKQTGSIGAVGLRGDGAFSAGEAGKLQESQNLAHSHAASTDQTGAHTHAVSGTAASAGAHSHLVPRSGTGGGDGFQTGPHDGGYNQTTSTGTHTHTVSATAASTGSHTHTVTVNNSGGTEARGKSATGCFVMRVK